MRKEKKGNIERTGKEKAAGHREKQSAFMKEIYEGISFFLMLLGMFFCIRDLLDTEVCLEALLLTAGGISAGAGIMKLGRKQKAAVSLVFLVILAITAGRNQSLLLEGSKEIANQVLVLVNEYYHTEYLLWFVEKESQGKAFAFVVLCAVLGFTEVILILLAGRKGRGKLAWGIFPALCVIVGLLVGKAPSFTGVLLLLAGFLAGQLDMEEKGVVPLFAAMVLAFGISVVFAASDTGNHLIEAYHDPWQERQLQMENKMLDMLEEFNDMVQFIGKRAQSEYVLENEKPNQQGKKIFRITVEECPRDAIYIRGFIGGDYENGSWKAVSKQEFSDWAQQQGRSNGECQEVVQGFPYQLLKEGQNDLYGLKSQSVKVELLDPVSGFTLAPYFTELPGKQSVQADGAWMPMREKNFQWRSYLHLTDGQAGMASDLAVTEDSQEGSIWKSYETYAREVYTRLPKDRLEGLRTYADNWNSQEMLYGLGDYAYVMTTTFAEEQSIQGSIQQIQNMLWSDTVYSFELEDVPEGTDYAEYFLLEQKKGYCVHYATTGTLLFRMKGIPARYVSGYIVLPGDFKENADGTYTAEVTDERGHAWTEVFQENIGFCPVEMTPPSYTSMINEMGSDEDVQSAVQRLQQTTADTTDTEQAEDKQAEGGQAEDGQEAEEEQVQQEQQKEQEQKEQEEPQKGAGKQKAEGAKSSQGGAETKEDFRIPAAVKCAAAFILGLFCLPGLLWGRRKRVLQKRQAELFQKNRTKGVLAIARRLKPMLHILGLERKKEMTDREYGAYLQKELPEMEWEQAVRILQKAAFSEKGVSEEEYQCMLGLYQSLEQKLYQEKGRVRKWISELIR